MVPYLSLIKEYADTNYPYGESFRHDLESGQLFKNLALQICCQAAIADYKIISGNYNSHALFKHKIDWEHFELLIKNDPNLPITKNLSLPRIEGKLNPEIYGISDKFRNHAKKHGLDSQISVQVLKEDDSVRISASSLELYMWIWSDIPESRKNAWRSISSDNPQPA